MHEQSLRNTEQEFLIVYRVSSSYVKSCMITSICLQIMPYNIALLRSCMETDNIVKTSMGTKIICDCS